MPEKLSALERMAGACPELEIWWDSSPLIFDGWVQEFLAKEEGHAKDEWSAQLNRLYDKANPGASVLKGCTTNPPLSLQAMQKDPEPWGRYIEKLIKNNPGRDAKQIFWLLYKDIVKRGAEAYLPIFEESNYKLGYISGQVDPRVLQDTAKMVEQGKELNATSPNIMIKMPGTREGIAGIEALTALGIPTNATLTFTVSQLVAVAEAVKRGLEKARAKNVDLSKWRSVVTMMLGRMEDAKEFDKQAVELGLELSETDKRWAGLAVFKKAYKLFKERGYQSRMLAASMRLGPGEHIWHLEKLVGEKLVLTIFPNIVEAFLRNYAGKEIKPAIDEDVPAEVLDKLLKVPYFQQAFNEDGLQPEEYISYAAVVETAEQFAGATDEMEGMVKIPNSEL